LGQANRGRQRVPQLFPARLQGVTPWLVTRPQKRLGGASVEVLGEAVEPATAYRPPSTVTRPAMFCGTYQTYCSALPSSNPTCLKQPWPGGTTPAMRQAHSPVHSGTVTDPQDW
jgi:hypothetical protein